MERGLHEARGSYRALLPLLNLPATDYKRLLSFLHQHNCHVAFQRYRDADAKTEADRSPSAPEFGPARAAG
jgi:hypothetical protein